VAARRGRSSGDLADRAPPSQCHPLVLTRRTLHETTLDWAEALLRALARSGRSGVDLLVAFRTVSGFVMGFAQAQLSDPLTPDEDQQDVARAQALPADRFPRLIEIAGAAAKLGADKEFAPASTSSAGLAR
jgi:hypothetical protein